MLFDVNWDLARIGMHPARRKLSFNQDVLQLMLFQVKFAVTAAVKDGMLEKYRKQWIVLAVYVQAIA